MQRILLVEDDPGVRFTVGEMLAGAFRLETAANLKEAREQLDRGKFDLVLLDIVLPDGEGYTLCAELRAAQATRNLPVIFVTGKVQVDDRILAYTLGADDYITKPFEGKELRARIEARLRRHSEIRAADEVLQVGDLRVLLLPRKAYLVAGTRETLLDLTPAEVGLLVCFLSAGADAVLDREALIRQVWGKENISDQALNTHVSNLRKKLERSRYTVHAVHGRGYRLLLKRPV